MHSLQRLNPKTKAQAAQALNLLTPSDSVHNWPLVCIPSIRHVIQNAEDYCRPKNEATPVHGFRSNSRRRWKKAEEQRNDDVYQTDRVHNRSDNWPHTPRSPVEFILDWIVAKSFVQDEGDGYHIRGHKTCHNDAYDCVESRGTANIYESEKKGDGSGDKNRVEG